MKKIISKSIPLIMAVSMAAAAMTACGGSAATAASDETLTLYGVNDLQISAAQMVAEENGYFAEEGLDVDCVYMANVPEIAAIMANGEAKIACANNYSTPTWVLNGADVVTIAPTCNMGGTQCLLLREGIELTDVSQLEGLTMGMVSGSTQYVTFMNMCEACGIDPDSITISTLQFADQLSALSKGQIDIMAVPEPWVTKAQEECNAQLLCSGTKSYIPGYEGDVLWCNMYACIDANREWLAENEETAGKVLKAIQKATDFINDNREEAVKILAEHIGMSEEDTAKIMTENVYQFGVDDTYVETTKTLEEFMVKENITPGGQSLAFEQYHDFSVLQEYLPDAYTVSE